MIHHFKLPVAFQCIYIAVSGCSICKSAALPLHFDTNYAFLELQFINVWAYADKI